MPLDDDKPVIPIENSNLLGVLKLRRRIESEEFKGNKLQYPLPRHANGSGENQSLSQAPPEHRVNLARRTSTNMQTFKKHFKEDSNSQNASGPHHGKLSLD